ncbi:MAG TPA: enoyl-CoA hydratase-related protein [Acetobacteraceae bacterium]|jgi:enoyl-CoA hydratase/carnithine racemase|nr:enoyl-CoA hydratase-related protein [Acetobacteraceae bacterium]
MTKPQSPYDPELAPKDLEYIKYEKKGHVAYVTINRPEVRNALHSYAYVELRKCWRDIGLDPNIYVGIVTGTGQAFCAGRDVKFLAAHFAEGKRTPHEDPNSAHFFWGGGGQPQDVKLEKPLIAAINGFAVGVGLNIILQCHLRVMADDAWLGDQHTNVGRLGAPHEIYQALPRVAAAYLTLCNGRLTAEQCIQWAIVNKVVPRDNVLAAAEELAEMVCLGSPLATQGAVRLYRLTGAFPEPLLTYARYMDQDIAETEDGQEGARAFREKRRPEWRLK